MGYEIKQKSLDNLKVAAKLNKNGLSNFKLIENKDITGHYIFRVVCERQDAVSEKSEWR